METMPLVSVVVPVYNVENYIADCIKSICRQTYQNLQIILIDDGSVDSSPIICAQSAKEDKRIQVKHQENRGVASARNAGIDLAAGRYVCFVDSDDCIHRNLIEIMVKLAEEKKASLVQADFCSVAQNYSPKEQKEIPEYHVYEFSVEQALRNLEVDCQEYSPNIRMISSVLWGKLYRRELFSKVRFQEGMRIHEDQMAVHRLIIQADGMVFCDAKLYFYRTNEPSLIRDKWKSYKLAILDCYKDRLECVKKIPASQEKTELEMLMCRKYFICIFKNYIMLEKYALPQEKKHLQKQLIERLRAESAEYGKLLRIRDKIFFAAFRTMPKLCVTGYSTFKRL